jgi:uncharacterized protein
MSCEEMDRRIREVIAAHEPDAAAVYVYGSEARGEATARSDVDVGLLLKHDPPKHVAGEGGLESFSRTHRFDLASKLTAELEREVDLVVLNLAPVDLSFRVIRDGRLVVEGDASRRVTFEVAVRREYRDLLPLLRICRRMPRRAG